MGKLDAKALKRLIAMGESNNVELKKTVPRPADAAERLCGLANAQGGYLIVGVEDESLAIVGVPEQRMPITKDMLLRGARQIQPALVLDPPEPEVYVIDGKSVVVVGVPPNKGALYQSSGVFWVRRGTYSIPLAAEEIFELANDRGLISWESRFTPQATMADIDMDRVKKHLDQRSIRAGHKERLEDLEKNLISMGCAAINRDGEIAPTNAGILFFGYDPQQFIRQSDVVCVLFRDELGVGGYIDRKDVRGTLRELIDEAEMFLDKHLTVGAKIEGWKRVDLPEYPLEALREAIVNAVIHRDYSKVGESIRVFYYPDRVEIHSPGLLIPGITVQQMREGTVRSKLRNPVMADLLKEAPGYMERLGSGVRFMISETKRMGLPAPDFKELGEFIVIFGKASSIGPQEQKKVVNTDFVGSLFEAEEELSEQNIELVKGPQGRLKLVVEYIREHGSISNREYRAIAGIALNTAWRDLDDWASKGILKSVGHRRGRIYKLP
jgi:predicted HTH transcriptional regulator